MPRIRITIRHNPDDPADDLRYAARVRSDLWAHSPANIDPDSGAIGTHRDVSRNAYFEFDTDMVDEVERVIRDCGHAARADVQVVQEEVGEACQNCGNVTGPVLPTICPTCNHRDIDPCPICGDEVPRQEYERIAGDLFKCPRCEGHVRLKINPDLWSADGAMNEPVVVVEAAEDMPSGIR